MGKPTDEIAEDLASLGHNSGDTEGAAPFARDQLKSIVERIERLEEEKKTAADDIRDVYAEAKGNGFDTKALRQIVRLRKMDADERREQETILETYMHALGMLVGTPLGDHALGQAAAGKKSLRRAVGEKVKRAVSRLGTPTELNAEEKAKGYSAAFIGKDGTRMAIGTGVKV